MEGRRRRRGHDARGAGRAAVQVADVGGRRHDERRRPQRRRPLRRHGARPSRGRDVLPVPDAAEPGPRCGPRAPHAAGPGRRGRRRADGPGGAPGGGRVQGAHRQVPPRRRDRDPPAPGRGPRCRGAGPLGAQALARGHRRHARDARRAGHAAPGPPAAVTQAGRAPGAQAAPRPQGSARLPGHDAALALDGRRADRAAVPPPAAGQARDLRDRGHLGLGRQLRPLHPAPRVRDLVAVLQGALASSSSTASTR